jgi:hypothetical protein
MTFEVATIFTDDQFEQGAIQKAEKPVDGRGTASRKHFLDAYAEHLEALKRERSTK